jgi:anti-sigma factor RsiW
MTANTISCQELVELVTDYIEGRLPAADRRRVDRHLKGCDGCSAYLEQARATIRLTGRLREEDLAPELRERLLGALRAWQPET